MMKWLLLLASIAVSHFWTPINPELFNFVIWQNFTEFMYWNTWNQTKMIQIIPLTIKPVKASHFHTLHLLHWRPCLAICCAPNITAVRWLWTASILGAQQIVEHFKLTLSRQTIIPIDIYDHTSIIDNHQFISNTNWTTMLVHHVTLYKPWSESVVHRAQNIFPVGTGTVSGGLLRL